jgi:three-Cys-motif partner protein
MSRLTDNDPAKWSYTLHTSVKHEILSRYLDPWVTILGKHNKILTYVDGFAGRGRYVPGNQPGSPLLVLDVALKALSRQGHQIRRIDCHLVEPDADNMANLRAEVMSHQAANNPVIQVYFHKAQFSAVSNAIIDGVSKSGQPAFFFLDPFGFDDPPMDVVQRILHLPKTETMINYMFNFTNRAAGMSNVALNQTLDRLHGNRDWSRCNGLSGESRETCLRENYRHELKVRGAKFVIPFRMGADERDRTLYYLFFTTNHVKGAMTMKAAMVASGSPGHVGYAGEERHRMQPLFNIDASGLPDLLRQLFKDRTLTYDQVITESIEMSGTCIDRDYRACLKAMEQQGQVTVTRITSKVRGLQGEDQITFH